MALDGTVLLEEIVQAKEVISPFIYVHKPHQLAVRLLYCVF